MTGIITPKRPGLSMSILDDADAFLEEKVDFLNDHLEKVLELSLGHAGRVCGTTEPNSAPVSRRRNTQS
jgi:hypothetical protein